MHVFFLEFSFSEGLVLLIIKFANARINIYETDSNIYDRIKYVNIFQCALKVFLVSCENQVSWLSVRSDYKLSSNRKRSYTDIEAIDNFSKNADISIFLNLLSREQSYESVYRIFCLYHVSNIGFDGVKIRRCRVISKFKKV